MARGAVHRTFLSSLQVLQTYSVHLTCRLCPSCLNGQSPARFRRTAVPTTCYHNCSQLIECFVDGPETRQTNLRWRTAAAILKNRKIAISPQPLDRFRWNLAWWCTWDLHNSSVVKINGIWKSSMAAGRHLEKPKKNVISQQPLTDFDIR